MPKAKDKIQTKKQQLLSQNSEAVPIVLLLIFDFCLPILLESQRFGGAVVDPGSPSGSGKVDLRLRVQR